MTNYKRLNNEKIKANTIKVKYNKNKITVIRFFLSTKNRHLSLISRLNTII